MINLFKKNKPSKWFIEATANVNSNTIHIQVYKHGVPYSRASMSVMPECKDIELEKTKFSNAIKLIYDGRED